MTLEAVLTNLINGNLTDAKIGAKSHSFSALVDEAQNVFGWSLDRAEAAAEYLKNDGRFQTYADIKE